MAGDDWSREEVEATIGDYFAMLHDELPSQRDTIPRIRSIHRAVAAVSSSSLAIKEPNERFGVSERVMDGMVIVLRPPQSLPLLGAPEVTDQPGREVKRDSEVKAEPAPGPAFRGNESRS